MKGEKCKGKQIREMEAFFSAPLFSISVSFQLADLPLVPEIRGIVEEICLRYQFSYSVFTECYRIRRIYRIDGTSRQ